MQPKLMDIFASVSDCCSMYVGLRVLCCIFDCFMFAVVVVYIFLLRIGKDQMTRETGASSQSRTTLTVKKKVATGHLQK